MAVYKDGQIVNEFGDRLPLPNNPVPAMSYVPYQQWGEDMHDAEDALKAGTLFQVLDKPFMGRGVMNNE